MVLANVIYTVCDIMTYVCRTVRRVYLYGLSLALRTAIESRIPYTLQYITEYSTLTTVCESYVYVELERSGKRGRADTRPRASTARDTLIQT